MKEIICKDCLAHYTEEFKHVCPPWIKAIVIRKRIIDENADFINKNNKIIIPSHEAEWR